MSEQPKLSRIEYIRLIGMWGAIFALVVFTYQLGQWNAMNTHNEIVKFCGDLVNSSVGIFNDVALWGVKP